MKVHDFRALLALSPAQAHELERLDAERRDARLERGTATLNTGASIPLVGLGTWQAPPGQVKAAVLTALRCGYRHIDCASVYGNEAEVGEALREATSGPGAFVPRSALFVTSKLWNDSHHPDRVEHACRESLERLGLDYLDLYLVHWPVVAGQAPGDALEPSYLETWRAMEGLVLSNGGGGSGGGDGSGRDKGAPQPLVRAIGVSNLSEKKLRALVSAPSLRVAPAVNQVELHPLWRGDALLRCCAELGVHVTAYSPLGSSPEATAAAMGDRDPPPPPLLRHPAVLAAAASASARSGGGGGTRSPAQVLLRWALERGASVLPRSVNPGRLAANLDVLSKACALSRDESALLSSIEPQARVVSGSAWLNPSGPYRALSDLWDEPEGADARRREAVAELRRSAAGWGGGGGA